MQVLPAPGHHRKPAYSGCESLSRVQLFVTPRTVAHQAPLSLEFSRQESWSGLPFPSSGDLPNPAIKPGSPALQEDSSPSAPGKRWVVCFYSLIRQS